MEIVCKSCGTINDYRTELKNNQNTAFCNSCGTFIKNIPYSKPKFYFGKYSGTLISDCDDLNYLDWFLNNTKPKANIKQAVETQIKTLKNE